MVRIGFTSWEVIVVLVLIFILFGHRLPSVMRSLGRSAIELRTEVDRRRSNAVEEWLVLVVLILIWLLMALFWRAMVWN
jgi:uncharacterized integral membrane protein